MHAARGHHTRDLDLIVWGATGYTGRLVARAVADRTPHGLRWALGGRDRDRLEVLRRELGGDPEVVVADARDASALSALARRTRAVVSTVGPYARHGTPLVAACTEAGTDYADLAAEPLWIRDTVDAFHERARDRGARLVHACGFDSVPSDLGVWLIQREAVARYGRPCREIVHAVGPLAGGVSGGTIASVLDTAERSARDAAARRDLRDPDLLARGGPPSRPAVGPAWPKRHAGLDGWTAPSLMATANAHVVRRSRALLGEPWGTDVRYEERLWTPTWARAAATGVAALALPALLAARPVRWLAERFLPRPGQGPAPRVREAGYFRTTLLGHVDGVDAALRAHVAADQDPGYGAAARMLAEVGLGLASGEFDAPGGVLTPAFVGRGRLVERLNEAGIRLWVEDAHATPRARATHERIEIGAFRATPPASPDSPPGERGR